MRTNTPRQPSAAPS
uniref:Uncharacterized protein n=1 Tax=Anguilla anguilla TaxID=7936 RepID=A0A0E9Y0Y0_ANGAN